MFKYSFKVFKTKSTKEKYKIRQQSKYEPQQKLEGLTNPRGL